MDDKLNEILESWEAGRNVLLYGPPATGKTRLISELFHLLNTPKTSHKGILLDPDNVEAPFSRPPLKLTIPLPVKVVWTTFHQSYGYEDFVLGLRPEITDQGTHLQPWAGVFLDAALELSDESSEYKSVVIFIDEINRGNAARIFGEFMTFLDFDYRNDGRVPLPLPLRQLRFKDGISEKINRFGAEDFQIPLNFTFPKHVYIVATMNSVDRAAVPVDSALARRFDRIEMRPNLDVLAQYWGVNKTVITTNLENNWENLTPFETSYLLLDRLNLTIASDLGPEFELGHGLLTSMHPITISEDGSSQYVEESDAWQMLATIWDDVVFPQLEDRYSGRPEQLLDLLRVDTPPTSGKYAWELRSSLSKKVEVRALAPVRLNCLAVDVIKRSFQWLIR